MALFGLRNHLQLLPVVLFLLSAESTSSLYLSSAIILRDFPRMIDNFKIFAYFRQHSNSSGFRTGSPADLFHLSLLRSDVLVDDPEEADLFYVSFSGAVGHRNIARSIRRIRSEFPFWNRTLGADHFFVSEEGIGESSDRNLVELRKNSIQISPFPAAPGRFIPHKDITLPSAMSGSTGASSPGSSFHFLAYYHGISTDPAVLAFLEKLKGISGVMIDSENRDLSKCEQMMADSKFCLFFYGFDDKLPLGDALKAGCVPIIVSGTPILDLPFSDVLQWSEIALIAPLQGGVEEIRRIMNQIDEEKHERMRKTAIRASPLFRWNPLQLPVAQEPADSFGALLYQLWRRRHTIRYARWALDS